MKDTEMENKDSQISILIIFLSNSSCSLVGSFRFTFARIFKSRLEESVCVHTHRVNFSLLAGVKISLEAT